MERVFTIPWVGEGKIPWVGVLIYHGSEVRYTMDRESDISWVEGQYTMGKDSTYYR
jgi:hypothetical protein